MLRHSQNNNLVLHDKPSYFGLPVQVDKGPFIQQYLEKLYKAIEHALNEHARVFAFRVDLRFPAGLDHYEAQYSNQIMEKFFSSFKAKIRHNRKKAQVENNYAHDSSVRYVWAREEGRYGKPHYHVVFLLNRDAFNSLGKFEIGRDNMFNRLQEAWASALGASIEAVRGLVEIPENPCYYLRRDGLGVEEFFYRASYLCQAATKVYGTGQHGFGSSRLTRP